MGVISKGYRVSFWCEENVLRFTESDNGCTTLHRLQTVEQDILNRWVVWCENYISIKKILFFITRKILLFRLFRFRLNLKILVLTFLQNPFLSQITKMQSQRHSAGPLHSFVYLFVERWEGREEEKERDIDLLPLTHTPTQDQTRNQGICPDQESNRWPFALQDDAQPIKPHWSGLCWAILNNSYKNKTKQNPISNCLPFHSIFSAKHSPYYPVNCLRKRACPSCGPKCLQKDAHCLLDRFFFFRITQPLGGSSNTCFSGNSGKSIIY